MKPSGRRVLVAALAVLVMAVAGLAGLIAFFPTEKLKGEVETRISTATGYAISIDRLGLKLSGFGLGLHASEVTAEAPDGSQSIRIPEMTLGVRLLPLLRREVRLTAAEARGVDVRLRPPRTAQESREPASAGSTRGMIAAPRLRVSDGKILYEGKNGSTRLLGVFLDGSFRSAGEGGVFEGHVSADSTVWTARDTPTRPILLPRIDLRFRSEIRMEPMSAVTALEGRVGSWPGQGTIDTFKEAGGFRNAGRFEMEAADLEVLKLFLAGEAARQIQAYELGGRIEGTRLRFETFAGREEMDYGIECRWAGVTAELPGKGRVVDGGEASFRLRPDTLEAEGDFRSGQSRFKTRARVLDFAAPVWTARVELRGPAADLSRFLPPDQRLEVFAGSVDADFDLTGRAGEKALPEASGEIRLTGLAFRHPALAPAVEQLNLTAFLDGRSARISDGSLRTSRSDMRFQGSIADVKKPRLDLIVESGTLDLDEIFPAGESPRSQPKSETRENAAAVPVAGRVSIKKLVRQKMVLTDVSSRFEVTPEVVRLEDIQGAAYGGTVRGRLTMRPAGESAWDYEGQFLAAGVKAEDILPAFTPIRGIEGVLRTRFEISGKNGPGINPITALTMAGTGLVVQGSFVNVPALQKVAQALQFTEASAEKIPFRNFRHHLKLENGYVVLDTFEVAQTSALWQLGGKVGLDGRLDCPVTVRIDKALLAEGGQLRALADVLAGSDGRLAVSLHLGGSLANPQVDLDLSPLVEEAKRRAKDSVVDQLKKKLGNLWKKN
jgi:hypothetical protein